MLAYLDNSATTRMFSSASEEMLLMAREDFANPSSLHRLGIGAENKIKKAREIIAGSIGADAKEIYFTSGGTEANNLAVLGYLRRNKRRGRKVICLNVEHPSILNIMKYLSDEGYTVSLIPVNKEGSPDYEALEYEIDESVALVSVMHVNNETGGVSDIKRVGEIIKRRSKNTVFHTDAVQAYLKIPFSVKDTGVDLLSLSAHKVNGPKGVGALFVKNGLHMQPLMWGGGQENGLRSGTENTCGICGFGAAVAEHLKSNCDDIERIRVLRDRLAEELCRLPGARINTNLENSAPHILNVSFLKIRSEILLHTLEQYGVYVSSGSACASRDGKKKKVLAVMGHDKDVWDSAIRISLSSENTSDELEYAAEVICREVKKLTKRL